MLTDISMVITYVLIGDMTIMEMRLVYSYILAEILIAFQVKY